MADRLLIILLVHPHGKANAASDCAHAQDQGKNRICCNERHNSAKRRRDATSHAGKTLHDAAQSASHAAGLCKTVDDLTKSLDRIGHTVDIGFYPAVRKKLLEDIKCLSDATAEVALIDRGQCVRKPLRDHVTLPLRHLAPDQIDKIQPKTCPVTVFGITKGAFYQPENALIQLAGSLAQLLVNAVLGALHALVDESRGLRHLVLNAVDVGDDLLVGLRAVLADALASLCDGLLDMLAAVRVLFHRLLHLCGDSVNGGFRNVGKGAQQRF